MGQAAACFPVSGSVDAGRGKDNSANALPWRLWGRFAWGSGAGLVRLCGFRGPGGAVEPARYAR